MNEDDNIIDSPTPDIPKPEESTSSAKQLFKIIIGGILIVFILLLTILYIKMLPILIKVLALAVNACVIYMCYSYLFKNKKQK
jgi:hypothetical protein